MFTLATVGSCRIATASRVFRSDYGYTLSGQRNYGYCHSSAEAVQQLRFMQGDFTPSEDIWPLIARGKDYDETLAETHKTADLYVVELSSAKRLIYGDTCVQLNYVGNEFRDFFSDKQRVRDYWAVVKTDKQDRIDAFLADSWSENLEQATDAKTLRHLRMVMTSEEDLRRDIRTIIDMVPNVLFVTHVNAVKPDGDPIESRSLFIDMVIRSVRAEGGIVYNPTVRMQEVGQTWAIEDHSDSLAHFTEDFMGVFFPDWYNMAIAPAMERLVVAGGGDAVRDVLAPHVTAMITSGRANAQLVRQLESMVQQAGPLPQLVLLQSKLDIACSSQDQALERLSGLYDQQPADAAIGKELLSMALDNGDVDLALNTLTRLQATPDVRLDASVLFDAGRNLGAKNKPAQAMAFLDVARSLVGRRITSAQAVLYVETALHADAAALADLPDSDLALLEAPLTLQRRLTLQAHARPGTFLTVCRDDILDLGGDDLLPLLSELTNAGNRDLALDVLIFWREAQGSTRLMHIGLRQFVDQYYETALPQAETVPQKLDVLTRVLHANPVHSDTRLALRGLRNTVLTDVRALYAAKDADGLAACESINARLPDPLLELPLMQARLAFEREDYAQAVSFAQAAVTINAEHFMSWLLLMRAALKADDLLVGQKAAIQVRDLATEDTDRYRDEAVMRLERLPALALRAGRTEEDPFVAYKLFQIAGRSAANADVVKNRGIRLEGQVMKSVREMEVDATPEDFFAFAEKAVALFPDNDRIRLSVARNLMRRKEFSAAAVHWQKAVDLDPENETYQSQLERCMARLAPAVEGA